MTRGTRTLPWLAIVSLAATTFAARPCGAYPEGDEDVPQVTEHLAAIRGQHGRLAQAVQFLELTIASPDRDPSQGPIYAAAMAKEIESFRALVVKIRTSGTRFGLTEERDLLREAASHVETIVAACRRLSGVEPPARTAEESTNERGWVRDVAVEVLQRELADRMEHEGLRDLLEDGAFSEGLRSLVPALRSRLDDALDRETKRLLGISFHDAQSLRNALRERVHAEVRKQVAKLLFRLSPDGIVVTLVTDLLLEWLGPKVREWLRNKGDLDERTKRSVEGLESRREALNAFSPDAQVEEVRRAVRGAEGALRATQHLDGDLKRVASKGGEPAAAAIALLDRLGAAKANLGRTVRLTTLRFLLENRSYREDFRALEQHLGEALRELDGLSKTPAIDFEALGDKLIGRWQAESLKGSADEFVIEFRRAECVRGGQGPCYEGRIARLSPKFEASKGRPRVGMLYLYARLHRDLSSKGTPYFEIQAAAATDFTKNWDRGFLAPLDMFADDVPEDRKYEKFHGVYPGGELVRVK